MIVVIKIGENATETYSGFAQLSKHLDIVDVLPRKRDSNGDLVERHAGIKGNKEYLCVNINTDDLNDDELNKLRHYLKKSWEDEADIDIETGKSRSVIAKRVMKFDLENRRSIIGMSDTTFNIIQVSANKKRTSEVYDVSSLNTAICAIKINFNLFAQVLINKKSGQSLYDEFDLAHKTLKQAIGAING